MNIVKELVGLCGIARDNAPTESEAFCYELLKRQYQKIDEAVEEKKGNFAIVSCYSPMELLHAMDILPLTTLLHAAITSMVRPCQDFLDAVTGYGVPVDICSMHRTAAGMAIAGAFPTPDFIIGTSEVCDPEIKTTEVIARILNRPNFYLEQVASYDVIHPHHWYNEGVVAYYKKELGALVGFIEKQTGKNLDIDRLREVIKLSNEAAALYREVSRLREHVPTPVRNVEFFYHCLIYSLFAGTQEAVDYFNLCLKDAREVVEGKRSLPYEEKHRISWLFCLPCYSMDLFNWMEKEHGVVIPVDMVNYWTGDEEEMDPSDPIDAIARKGYWAPLAAVYIGPGEKWSERAVELSQKGKVEAAVIMNNYNCKEGCFILRLIRDTVQERLGIPVKIIDADVIDPSLAPPDSLKDELEGFFETLEE